ncbi:hypothetical protein SDC9_172941 [bioreactor metagenome]|uniref:DUF5049 domain-containing protein n=1 Tax=bioreactor metagenome TaxID=1076179 RepID=A0A645GIB8_9ZZZZ
MTEQIKEQILKIRDTGLTNMFNTGAVQWIASHMGFSELAAYLEETDAGEYVHFILSGEG